MSQRTQTSRVVLALAAFALGACPATNVEARRGPDAARAALGPPQPVSANVDAAEVEPLHTTSSCELNGALAVTLATLDAGLQLIKTAEGASGLGGMSAEQQVRIHDEIARAWSYYRAVSRLVPPGALPSVAPAALPEAPDGPAALDARATSTVRLLRPASQYAAERCARHEVDACVVAGELITLYDQALQRWAARIRSARALGASAGWTEIQAVAGSCQEAAKAQQMLYNTVASPEFRPHRDTRGQLAFTCLAIVDGRLVSRDDTGALRLDTAGFEAKLDAIATDGAPAAALVDDVATRCQVPRPTHHWAVPRDTRR